MARYILHGHFLSGPTYKVALMLSLAQADWRFRLVDLRAGAHKSPEFLEMNRFGQVPALEDGDLTLCQSGAILEHLAIQTGRLGGTGQAEQARAREWIFWSFDVLSPGIFRSRAINAGFMKAGDEVKAHYHAMAERALGTLDAWLAGRGWLGGGDAPTIADVDVAAVLHYAGDAGFDLADRQALKSHLDRVRALPGYLSPDGLQAKAQQG